MTGIDVSKHQGVIDWQKVKAAGIEFAIVRAGYGMYENQVDSRFAENMAGAKAAGIPVGVYWYSYAVSISEAIREAEACIKTIEPYQSQIVLPVAYDWEDKTQGAMTADTTAACCKAFLDRIAAAGYRPMLYSFSNWLETRLQDPRLDEFPRWVAHVGVEKPVCSKPYLMWQYSHTGTVSGISGNVDLNEGGDGLMNGNGWVWTGSVWYFYRDGEPIKNQWVKTDGWWYRLGSDGKMLTGLQEIDGKAYPLNDKPKGIAGIYIPAGALMITNDKGEIIHE